MTDDLDRVRARQDRAHRDHCPDCRAPLWPADGGAWRWPDLRLRAAPTDLRTPDMKNPTPTYAMRDAAARFLAAVYGPAGPIAGARAWHELIAETTDRNAARPLTGPGALAPYRPADAIEAEAIAEHVPDYLNGLSRSELWRDVANWIDANADAIAETRGQAVPA